MPTTPYAVPSDGGTPGQGARQSRDLVFVVDDNNTHRREVREILEEEGYEVIAAADGREALEQLIGRNFCLPAVMLLDLSMPVMSGWELLAVLSGYVRLTSFPIVLLSGAEPRLDPLKHGTIAAFLRKPYDLRTLLETIARVIAAAKARASK
jgi:chemosensory pili system protein ChpA (sensor histidine kinase/response regulator)